MAEKVSTSIVHSSSCLLFSYLVLLILTIPAPVPVYEQQPEFYQPQPVAPQDAYLHSPVKDPAQMPLPQQYCQPGSGNHPSGYNAATPLHALGRGPTPVDCPICGVREMTRSEAESGNTNHGRIEVHQNHTEYPDHGADDDDSDPGRTSSVGEGVENCRAGDGVDRVLVVPPEVRIDRTYEKVVMRNPVKPKAAVHAGSRSLMRLTTKITMKLSQNVKAHWSSQGPGAGAEVHKWTLPYRAGRHARLLQDGTTLAYNGAHPDASRLFPMWSKYRGGVMMQVSPEGKILREYHDPMAHHDQHHLPDGKILYTTVEALTAEQAARVQGGTPETEAPGGIVYGGCIRLVEPWGGSTVSSSVDFASNGEGSAGAKLLWEWRAVDHLDTAVFAMHPDYPREHWALINSVSFDRGGNMVASMRNTSSVVGISRETGEVLWHLGQPIVNQQHCAHELPSGDLLILENGVFRLGVSVPHSRAVVVSRRNKVVWEYMDRSTGGIGLFTPFMGSAQQLGNGNIVVCEAAPGRVIEVTEGGEVLWEFVVPQLSDYRGVLGEEKLGEMEKMGFTYESNVIFRAYKYLSEEVSWLKGKESDC
ncbi:hypothetical protein BBP40_005140 [Aspergillus hancockii]|nr:hypothetical protein BBP40_005140 [Aspergillus hancockii]